jgi:hypothetical protein
MSIRKLSVSIFVCLFACASVAWAAPINYGNVNGETVVYQQVTEDSSTDPGATLYGAPTASGDALLFNPSFGATGSGGASDQTFGSLTSTIVAIQNSRIEYLQFQEEGDFSLAGSGTTASMAEVAATFNISIIQVDGVDIAPVLVSEQMMFTVGGSPSDGQFNIVDEPGLAQPWAGTVAVDLNQALLLAGVSGRATKVEIELDNRLLAASEATSYAYIKKKDIGGFAITAVTEIPEPATMCLLALGGLAMLKRKK